MHSLKFAAALVLSLAAAVPALAQTPTRIRGAITSVEGPILNVKTRNGEDVKIKMADNVNISLVLPIALSDIKKGSFIGSAAVPQPDGKLKALEVVVFPEAMRGTGEGHYDWDLMPKSSMTNANVASVLEGTNGRELSLTYKGGENKIMVPPGTPVVTFAPGDKSMLKPGAFVFVVAQPAADGSFSAARVAVGKDGLKPPM